MMEKMQKTVAMVGAFLVAASASAYQGPYDPKYFTVDSVEIEQVESGETIVVPANKVVEKQNPVRDLQMFFTLGKEIWQMIENNKPVVNVRTDSVTVLPQGFTAPVELSGWQPPKSKTYEFRYKNLYGMNVVSVTYRLLFTYGGGVEGVGQYLSNVTVVPADLRVSWGFKMDAECSIPNIVNLGTEENPVAGVELLVNWKVNTVFQHQESSLSFFVQGDGESMMLE